MSETDPHLMVVQYDAGYQWLECRCHARIKVGMAPTPAELWAAEQKHRQEKAGGDTHAYGTLILGAGHIEQDSLAEFTPVGWYYDGELHYFEGQEPE